MTSVQNNRFEFHLIRFKFVYFGYKEKSCCVLTKTNKRTESKLLILFQRKKADMHIKWLVLTRATVCTLLVKTREQNKSPKLSALCHAKLHLSIKKLT